MIKDNGPLFVVEKLEEFCGRVIEQIDRETHEWQVVGLEHGVRRCILGTPSRTSS
jgi:hypothetical protein